MDLSLAGKMPVEIYMEQMFDCTQGHATRSKREQKQKFHIL